MVKNIFYHNPRCRKSREGLALVKEKGVDIEVVEYLKNPPEKEEMKEIIGLLKIKPLALIRTQEKIFKELKLSKKDLRTDDEWIKIMVDNPILIERPILVYQNKAALGRPVDNLLKLF
jgi:arsenate reductase